MKRLTKIDPSLYLSNNTANKSGSSALGKDEFMKILMVQLQNQDPLEPLKDTDFIAQMATFSSLEQLMNISSSMEYLSLNQSNASLLDYSHLIGKEVSYNTYNDEGLLDKVEKGKVQSISFRNNDIQVVLENGEKIDTKDIIEIAKGTTEPANE
ncbi:flagellar hook assembly protein FlgD [Salirhabdus sp. Marseille-P4669]|uniref:flagellar hook assembly protein FlgD n=1 Tax=Salirhabdus sp. Marseille-P4669 TaxID=2042310 RepID=UPI001F2C20F7|nr:flagellar hook assembly protein FlgD [Salirhabdus sp. Marseille-P4669]